MSVHAGDAVVRRAGARASGDGFVVGEGNGGPRPSQNSRSLDSAYAPLGRKMSNAKLSG